MIKKLFFGICENKGTDQLHDKIAADQCLCSHYIDSTIPQLPIEISSHLSVCTARFVVDLVGNPEDMFSYDMA